jgi:hypothetical protein
VLALALDGVLRLGISAAPRCAKPTEVGAPRAVGLPPNCARARAQLTFRGWGGIGQPSVMREAINFAVQLGRGTFRPCPRGAAFMPLRIGSSTTPHRSLAPPAHPAVKRPEGRAPVRGAACTARAVRWTTPNRGKNSRKKAQEAQEFLFFAPLAPFCGYPGCVQSCGLLCMPHRLPQTNTPGNSTTLDLVSL